MQTYAPFKERLIQYRMETEDRSLEPASSPRLLRSIARIRLGVLVGFGIIAAAAAAFMSVAGGR